MVYDQDQRTLEIVKLRIAFLQHITTLSGAATLIVLALMQRAPDSSFVVGLALVTFVFGLATIISLGGIAILIYEVQNAGPNLSSRAGRATTYVASGLFGAGVVFIMQVAFRVPTITALIIGGGFVVITGVMLFLLTRWD